MAFTKKPPQPPGWDVPMTDPAWRDYFIKVTQYMAEMAAAIP